MSKTIATFLRAALAHLGCVFLACLLLPKSCCGAGDNLAIPPNAGCACPGDVLTYTCTSVGGGNTIWRGSAFDCPASSDEIILRHSQFAGAGARGSCTNEVLRAESLRVENGNCYVSQLNATVSDGINGRSIRCEHNSNLGTRLVGESMVNVISVTNQYPAPTNIGLAEVTEAQITFNWTAVCSTAQFLVESNCGLCSASTNTSTVTCDNFQLPTDSNDTMCSFSVTGMACDMTSDLTTSAVVRVPDVPTVSTIIPTYYNESRRLTRVEFTPVVQTEVINTDISGPILNYIPAFLSSNGIFHSTRVPAQSGGGPFNYTVDVPPELCSTSTNVNLNVSAANQVGRGFPSDAEPIECVNSFVRVYFDSNSTITCVFIDELDATEKSCRIDYGLYDNGLTNSSLGRSTNNTISLNLMNLGDGRYQYVILATSNMTTVRVEGNFTKDPSKGNITVEIIIAVIVVVLVLVGAAVLAITLFTVCKCRRNGDIHEVLNLKEIKNQQLKLHKVDKDCTLGEFFEGKLPGAKYQRGYAYYELTEREDVYERQKIILQKRATGKLYTPRVDSSVLREKGLLGEGVTQPYFSDEYRVFVQSMGSGKRHVQANSHVICVEPDEHAVLKQSGIPAENSSSDAKQHCEDKEQSLILQAPKDYFVPKQIDTKGMSLMEFWEKYELRKKRLNIFLEVSKMVEKPIEVRDVLLMDKVTGNLFSDPVALRKVKENKEEEIDSKWRVLVLGKYQDYSKVTLKPGMWVAYENPKLINGKYRALQVQEDNMRMSDFIKREIYTFERGKAYYEFKEGDEEDLLYCRRAIRIRTKKVQQLLVKDYSSILPDVQWGCEASIETFYTFLRAAPGVGVKSPASKEWRFFIQSTSQGARCLKKGTVVLYMCGEHDTKKDGPPVNVEQEDDDEGPPAGPPTGPSVGPPGGPPAGSSGGPPAGPSPGLPAGSQPTAPMKSLIPAEDGHRAMTSKV